MKPTQKEWIEYYNKNITDRMKSQMDGVDAAILRAIFLHRDEPYAPVSIGVISKEVSYTNHSTLHNDELAQRLVKLQDLALVRISAGLNI